MTTDAMDKDLPLCPRCRVNRYTPYSMYWLPGMPQFPATSRMDNSTEICSPCGTDEAMRDFAGVPAQMQDWPVHK